MSVCLSKSKSAVSRKRDTIKDLVKPSPHMYPYPLGVRLNIPSLSSATIWDQHFPSDKYQTVLYVIVVGIS